MSVETAAAELVDRTRQGDQNAEALICQIRDTARKGNVKAKKALQALEEYVQKHPIEAHISFGEESQMGVEVDFEDERKCDVCAHAFYHALANDGDYVKVVRTKIPPLVVLSVNKAITSLANGPSLLAGRHGNLIAEVRESFTEEEQLAFADGIKHGITELASVRPDLQAAFLFGHVLGTARAYQAVRLPHTPLRVLGPQVGAEFGE